MEFWKKLESWWFGSIPEKYHMASTWVGHGLVTALFVIIGTLVGLMVGHIILGAAFGLTFGLGGYFFREGSEILEGGWGNKIDHLGDILGPIILGGLTFLIVVLVTLI